MNSQASAREKWAKFFDKDVELILSSRAPANEDLAPLGSFVAALNRLGELGHSEEVVDAFASLASLTVTQSGHRNAVRSGQDSGTLSSRIRTRAGALLASLAMISGVTGVAWASDSAAPGDWNYGIDRALEVIGIGDGGLLERGLEMAGPPSILNSQSAPADSYVPKPSSGDSTVGEVMGLVGLHRAAQVLRSADVGNDTALEVHVRVADQLDYLSNRSRGANGGLVSQMVNSAGEKGKGRPQDLPAESKKGEPPGKPSATGSRSH